MADNTISLYKLRNKINACLLDKFNYVRHCPKFCVNGNRIQL